eukprot:GHVL01020312.1.p1 GENE.GHVL01020312.1~~GHVL01020312.1.p1  ORF type:complete len:258 (+),score=83.38 GHVL01020312.1:51-824(+)
MDNLEQTFEKLVNSYPEYKESDSRVLKDEPATFIKEENSRRPPRGVSKKKIENILTNQDKKHEGVPEFHGYPPPQHYTYYEQYAKNSWTDPRMMYPQGYYQPFYPPQAPPQGGYYPIYPPHGCFHGGGYDPINPPLGVNPSLGVTPSRGGGLDHFTHFQGQDGSRLEHSTDPQGDNHPLESREDSTHPFEKVSNESINSKFSNLRVPPLPSFLIAPLPSHLKNIFENDQKCTEEMSNLMMAWYYAGYYTGIASQIKT